MLFRVPFYFSWFLSVDSWLVHPRNQLMLSVYASRVFLALVCVQQFTCASFESQHCALSHLELQSVWPSFITLSGPKLPDSAPSSRFEFVFKRLQDKLYVLYISCATTSSRDTIHCLPFIILSNDGSSDVMISNVSEPPDKFPVIDPLCHI